VYPKGPATVFFGTDFCVQANAEMVTKFQLLLRASRAAAPDLSLSALNNLLWRSTLTFPNFEIHNEARNQNPAALI
jgi:hypothetical protein